MIGFALSLAARAGIPKPLRTVAAWAGLLIATGLLVLAGRAVFDRWLAWHDRQVIADYKIEQRAIAAEKQAQIEANAAQTRVKDAVANTRQQEAYHDAIHNPPAGADPDPAVRLACERLRRSGQSTAELPQCRRRSGIGGAQAGSAPGNGD